MLAVLSYLDPGSGSMLLQLILGGAAAAGVGLKMTWRRVLRVLHLDRQRESDPDPSASN
jgi:hypothetical protein